MNSCRQFSNGQGPATAPGHQAEEYQKEIQALFGSGGKPIKPADIAIFTRQMATMIKAGVPLVQSFEIVAEGSENPRCGNWSTLFAMMSPLAAAWPLSLAKHPRLFDDLFCSWSPRARNRAPWK